MYTYFCIHMNIYVHMHAWNPPRSRRSFRVSERSDAASGAQLRGQSFVGGQTFEDLVGWVWVDGYPWHVDGFLLFARNLPPSMVGIVSTMVRTDFVHPQLHSE